MPWVAHEPSLVLLLFVAGSSPERHRTRVRVGDDCRQPYRPPLAQTPLALPEQHRRKPLAPTLGQHGQPVKAPPPAIPRRYQRTDYNLTNLGDEQCLWVGAQQRGKAVGGVADARGAACRAHRASTDRMSLLVAVRIVQAGKGTEMFARSTVDG